MGLGRRILRLRLQSGMTQKEVSDSTGLAVSYLSRLENEHVTPSVPTLGKIAEAFGESVRVFFEHEPEADGVDRCPVSVAGVCILDQLLVAKGRRPKSERRGYTIKQLEMLRICDFLVHTRDRRIVESLNTVLESLLALACSKGANFEPLSQVAHHRLPAGSSGQR